MTRYTALPSDQKIINDFLAGNSVMDMAIDMGISREYIRRILRRHGHEPELLDPVPSYKVNEIWSLPEDKLRYAIYEKARKGARDTLRGKNG